jgi:hypothetical protein
MGLRSEVLRSTFREIKLISFYTYLLGEVCWIMNCCLTGGIIKLAEYAKEVIQIQLEKLSHSPKRKKNRFWRSSC